MFWNYLNMLTGIFIAVANYINPGFRGVFEWIMVGCGVLIFAYNLIVILNQKQNKEISKEED
ncbi:hypothetical protein O0Q50_21980 [Priestia aryabhattai]|uniref:Uncharacterized protein n=1 Tax=Priestia aryabhattai TaxID=412384 RepID=A0AAX6NDC5_PRIAR|nr:hypothetical protein [Priestia aryabhattai]MDU9693852.1 hypothetical protein [Priestia aryabhattai]